ncbi:GerAB/ArcD/ProY family transporter [Gorillibacterium sp. sgz5001074]|uniref:GerAB/ArcD/ProY family transporter n=1 Tax=Gorillibacterium sp. sgz5001074 TaxID=3446695 RepID=UPI003F66644B
MRRVEQISTNQFVWMLFIIITSVTVLQAPGILIKTGHRDAWIAVIGGVILDVMLALAYAYMGVRFPKENFVQYSSTILGRGVGKVVGLCFPLFFLLACVLVMRSLGMIIHTAFLPKTPLPIITFSGFAVVAYAARKGIEVIGRIAEILGPIYFASAFVVSFMLMSSADIDRIRPLLEDGLEPIIRGSFYIVSFYGICIMMAMFIPICNRPENGFLAKFGGVTMGGFLVGVVVFFSIVVFGYKQAINKISPSLALLRTASVSHFLERFEMLWMLTAVGAAIMASAQLIWAFSVGLADTFGLKDYKPLILSSALVAVVLEETSFPSQPMNAEFLQFTFPCIAFFVETVLELLLLLFAFVLKKGEKNSFRSINFWPFRRNKKQIRV